MTDTQAKRASTGPADLPDRPITVAREGPLTIVTWHGKTTDAQFAEHLAEMSTIIESCRHKPERQIVINDASRWVHSNAVQRKMQADWMLKYDAEMRFKTAAVVFVVTSGLTRGGLSAILWLAPLPCPHKMVATLEEAKAWALEVLLAETEPLSSGRSMPPRPSRP